ncbi:toxin glutamine deamidase domain-containing protein [Streptomyces sp. NPDC093252]|uniref:toxin glutamine deamidase domain-containing protein n=1 Tax=Streptomyces sp. NPDC093252 TaxID=3154980 RepID=UPI0034347C4B
MASDELNGLFLALTGSQMPNLDPKLLREYLSDPQRELDAQLGQLQELLVEVARSVSGTSNGQFSEAYYEAMLSLSSPEGTSVLEGLREAARELADFADESAYQVEYTNLMILLQLAMFVVEFAITLIMAIFNPAEAMVRQSFLRAFYRMVLNSLVARLLASIAMQQVLQIGLAVALDRLAQWMLARDGKVSSKGNTYLTQAVGFGAVAGFVAVPVQFAASWLAQNLTKTLTGGVRDNLFNSLRNALDNRPRPSVVKDAGDDTGGGAVVRPVAAPRPGNDVDGFAGGGPLPAGGTGRDPLSAPGGSAGPDPVFAPPRGSGPDPVFARDFADRVSDVADLLARNTDPQTVGGSFIDDMGEIFATRFGGETGDGPARGLGRDWAETFLANVTSRDLGDALRSVLLDGRLPGSFGDGVVRAMSGTVGELFGPGSGGGKFLDFVVQGIGDGVIGVVSELVYNGIAFKQLSVSGGGFLTSITSERAVELSNGSATWLASKLRPQLPTGLGLDLGTGNPERAGLPPTVSTADGTTGVVRGPVNSGGGNVGGIDTSTLTTAGGDGGGRSGIMPGSGVMPASGVIGMGNGFGPAPAPVADDLLTGTEPLRLPGTPVVDPTPTVVPLPEPVPPVGAGGTDDSGSGGETVAVHSRLSEGDPVGAPALTPGGPLIDVPVPLFDVPVPSISSPVPVPVDSADGRVSAAEVVHGGPRLDTDVPVATPSRAADVPATRGEGGLDPLARDEGPVPASPPVSAPRPVPGPGGEPVGTSRLPETVGTPRSGADGSRAGDLRTADPRAGESRPPADRPRREADPAGGSGERSPDEAPGPVPETERPVTRPVTRTADRLFDVLSPTTSVTASSMDAPSDPRTPTATVHDPLTLPTDTDSAAYAATAHPDTDTDTLSDAGSDTDSLYSTDSDHSDYSDHSDTSTSPSTVLTDPDPASHPDPDPDPVTGPTPSTSPHPSPSAFDDTRLRTAVDIAITAARDEYRTTTTPTAPGTPRNAPVPLRVLNCVVLLDSFRSQLYRDASDTPLPRAVRAAVALDDSAVGSRRAEDRLAPGPGWGPVTSWPALASGLGHLGPGATALIITQHRTGVGHAFAMHQSEQGMRWIEMQAEHPGKQVRDTLPLDEPFQTRAVLIGPDGRITDPARPLTGADGTISDHPLHTDSAEAMAKGSALVDSLVDPPRSHEVGAIGYEAELLYPLELGPSAGFALHLGDLLAKHDSGATIVVDRRTFFIDTDGRRHLTEQAAGPGAKADKLPIPELVSPPLQVLPGEQRMSAAAGLALNRAVREALERTDDPAQGTTELAELLRTVPGWTVAPGMHVVGVARSPAGAGHSAYTQLTVGVPPAGLTPVLDLARAHLERPWLLPLVDAGRIFADMLTAMHAAEVLGRQPEPHEYPFLSHLPGLAELHGYAWLGFQHVAAPPFQDVERPNSLMKNMLPAASRTPFATLRGALAPGIRDFLDRRAAEATALFEVHLVDLLREIAPATEDEDLVDLLDELFQVVPESFTTGERLETVIRGTSAGGTPLTQWQMSGMEDYALDTSAGNAELPLALLELRHYFPRPELRRDPSPWGMTTEALEASFEEIRQVATRSHANARSFAPRNSSELAVPVRRRLADPLVVQVGKVFKILQEVLDPDGAESVWRALPVTDSAALAGAVVDHAGGTDRASDVESRLDALYRRLEQRLAVDPSQRHGPSPENRERYQRALEEIRSALRGVAGQGWGAAESGPGAGGPSRTRPSRHTRQSSGIHQPYALRVDTEDAMAAGLARMAADTWGDGGQGLRNTPWTTATRTDTSNDTSTSTPISTSAGTWAGTSTDTTSGTSMRTSTDTTSHTSTDLSTDPSPTRTPRSADPSTTPADPPPTTGGTPTRTRDLPVVDTGKVAAWQHEFDGAHEALAAMGPVLHTELLVHAQDVMAWDHVRPTTGHDSAGRAGQYRLLFENIRAVVAHTLLQGSRIDRPGDEPSRRALAAAQHKSRELRDAFGTGGSGRETPGGAKKGKKKPKGGAGTGAQQTATQSGSGSGSGTASRPAPGTSRDIPHTPDTSHPPGTQHAPGTPGTSATTPGTGITTPGTSTTTTTTLGTGTTTQDTGTTPHPSGQPDPTPAPEDRDDPLPIAPGIRIALKNALSAVPDRERAALRETVIGLLQRQSLPRDLTVPDVVAALRRFSGAGDSALRERLKRAPDVTYALARPDSGLGTTLKAEPLLVAVLRDSPELLDLLAAKKERWHTVHGARLAAVLVREGTVPALEAEPEVLAQSVMYPRLLANLDGDVAALSAISTIGIDVFSLADDLPAFGAALRTLDDPVEALWRLGADAGLYAALRSAGAWREAGTDPGLYADVLGDAALQDRLRPFPEQLNLALSSRRVLAAVKADPEVLGLLRDSAELTDVLEDLPGLTARLLENRALIKAAAGNPHVATALSHHPERYDHLTDDGALAEALRGTGPPQPTTGRRTATAPTPAQIERAATSAPARGLVRDHLRATHPAVAALFDPDNDGPANRAATTALSGHGLVLTTLALHPDGTLLPHQLRRLLARTSDRTYDLPPEAPARLRALLALTRHAPLRDVFTFPELRELRAGLGEKLGAPAPWPTALYRSPALASLTIRRVIALDTWPLERLLTDPWLPAALSRIGLLPDLMHRDPVIDTAAMRSDAALLRLASRYETLQYQVGGAAEWRAVAERVDAAPDVLGDLAGLFGRLPVAHWLRLLTDDGLLRRFQERRGQPFTRAVAADAGLLREVLARPAFLDVWDAQQTRLDELAVPAVAALTAPAPHGKDSEHRGRADVARLRDEIEAAGQATLTPEGFILDASRLPVLERLVDDLTHERDPAHVRSAGDPGPGVLDAYGTVLADDVLRPAATGNRYLAEGLLFDPAFLRLLRTRPSLLTLLRRPDLLDQVRRSPDLIRLLTTHDPVFRVFLVNKAVRTYLRDPEFLADLDANPHYAEVFHLHGYSFKLFSPTLTDLAELIRVSPAAAEALGSSKRISFDLLAAAPGLVAELARQNSEPVIRVVLASTERVESAAAAPRLVKELGRIPGLAELLAGRPDLVSSADSWNRLLDNLPLVKALAAAGPELVARVVRPDVLPVAAAAPDLVVAMSLMENGSWAGLTTPEVLRLVTTHSGLAPALVTSRHLRALLAGHRALTALLETRPDLLRDLMDREELAAVVRAAPWLTDETPERKAVWLLVKRHPAFGTGLTTAVRGALGNRGLVMTLFRLDQEQVTADLVESLYLALRRSRGLAGLLAAQPEFAGAFLTRADWRAAAGRDRGFAESVRRLAEERPADFGELVRAEDSRRLLDALNPPARPDRAAGNRTAPTSEPPQRDGPTGPPPKDGRTGAPPKDGQTEPPQQDARTGPQEAAPSRTGTTTHDGTAQSQNPGPEPAPDPLAADPGNPPGTVLSHLPPELADLLTGPRGPGIATALDQHPELLPLFTAVPARADEIDAHPERLDDLTFRAFLQQALPATDLDAPGGDPARTAGLERYFAEYLASLDIGPDAEQRTLLRSAVQHTWRAVLEERRGLLADAWRERLDRFTAFRATITTTWALSGRVHYAGDARYDDFDDADRKIIDSVAATVQAVRESPGTRAVNRPLHAHLNGGNDGVAFFFVLTGDGTVDTVVYARSEGRSGNRYRWQTGGPRLMSSAPPPIDGLANDPLLARSRQLTDLARPGTRDVEPPPSVTARPLRAQAGEWAAVQSAHRVAEATRRLHTQGPDASGAPLATAPVRALALGPAGLETRARTAVESARASVPPPRDGGDTPLSVVNCVILLENLLRRLYRDNTPAAFWNPDRPSPAGSGLRTTYSRDDLDLGFRQGRPHRADQRLAEGPGWAPVTEWEDLRQALAAAGTGSTALILTAHENRDGHAYAAHHTTDGIRWIEMQAPRPEDLLSLAPPTPTPPGRTRAVIVDPYGTIAPHALTYEPDLTAANALLDPARPLPYGRLGVEGELVYVLESPSDFSFWKDLARHTSGAVLTVDQRVLHLGADNKLYMSRQTARQETGQESTPAVKKILELVTPPLPALRQEGSRRDAEAGMDVFVRTRALLERTDRHNRSFTLRELLDGKDGWTLPPDLPEITVLQSPLGARHPIYTQFTVGVPVAGLTPLLDLVRRQLHDRLLAAIMDQGRTVADQVATLFAENVLGQRVAVHQRPFLPYLPLVAETHGLAWLAFNHIAAHPVQWRLEVGGVAKNMVAAASRVPFGPVHSTLNRSVREFLAQDEKAVVALFEAGLRDLVRHIGTRWKMTVPGAERTEGILDERMQPSGVRVRDYLSTALLGRTADNRQVLQQDTVGMRDYALDDGRGTLELPLVLLELRQFRADRNPSRPWHDGHMINQQIRAAFNEIRTTSDDLYQNALRLARDGAPQQAAGTARALFGQPLTHHVGRVLDALAGLAAPGQGPVLGSYEASSLALLASGGNAASQGILIGARLQQLKQKLTLALQPHLTPSPGPSEFRERAETGLEEIRSALGAIQQPGQAPRPRTTQGPAPVPAPVPRGPQPGPSSPQRERPSTQRERPSTRGERLPVQGERPSTRGERPPIQAERPSTRGERPSPQREHPPMPTRPGSAGRSVTLSPLPPPPERPATGTRPPSDRQPHDTGPAGRHPVVDPAVLASWRADFGEAMRLLEGQLSETRTKHLNRARDLMSEARVTARPLAGDPSPDAARYAHLYDRMAASVAVILLRGQGRPEALSEARHHVRRLRDAFHVRDHTRTHSRDGTRPDPVSDTPAASSSFTSRGPAGPSRSERHRPRPETDSVRDPQSSRDATGRDAGRGTGTSRTQRPGTGPGAADRLFAVLAPDPDTGTDNGR